ncbi:hypothetical protein [Streptomyces sp. NPDC007905]|uniref:hypothetical protein n=1 Tax=Streptomyces sp. NPDC007905 TaxID=3364788 RepID=UPI0036E88CAB
MAVDAVVLQATGPGAMDALDHDPRRTGWWRVVTSVFLQNGGFFGGAWNIVTPAVVAAPAQWFWGGPLMLTLFAGASCCPSGSTLPSGGRPPAPTRAISRAVRAPPTFSPPPSQRPSSSPPPTPGGA